MSNLVDSNVWLALTFESHEHHSVAYAWMEGIDGPDAALFCRMTQNSFLRLATSVRFFREDALTNRAALAAYRDLRADYRTGWIEEPAGVEERWWTLADRGQPEPRVWMDAYLAAFAIHAGVRFITFDDGFEKYKKQGLDLMLLSPAVPPT